MAGTNSGFDPVAFRTAIRFAMNLGAPNDPADQATFVFREKRTYGTHDPGGDPYDWTSTPATDVAERTVQVPVAVHFGGVDPQQAGLVEFNPNKIRLTLLDTDYAQIEGADSVLLGQDEYVIDFVAPPQALFDVDVLTVYATARDAR